MRYLHLEIDWDEQRDKSEMRKRVKQWTVIGVTDENFNFSNVISDLVMPFKINVTKYFKYV